MSSLDIILAVIVIWGFYQGWSNGIIQTVFTLLSYFFGLLLAFKLTPSTTRFLQSFFHSENPLMMVAGFLVVFVGVMLLFRLMAKGLENAFNFAHLGMLNSLLGGTTLALIYTALFSVLVWFADKAKLIDSETKQAISWPLLEKLPPKAQQITSHGESQHMLTAVVLRDGRFQGAQANHVQAIKRLSHAKCGLPRP